MKSLHSFVTPEELAALLSSYGEPRCFDDVEEKEALLDADQSKVSLDITDTDQDIINSNQDLIGYCTRSMP